MNNRMYMAFQVASDWGDANLVTFNGTKTQRACFLQNVTGLYITYHTPVSDLPRCFCADDRRPTAPQRKAFIQPQLCAIYRVQSTDYS